MKTLNTHLQKNLCTGNLQDMSVNAQRCQHLATQTKNKAWWVPFNLPFLVYNVKILHWHFP